MATILNPLKKNVHVNAFSNLFTVLHLLFNIETEHRTYWGDRQNVRNSMAIVKDKLWVLSLHLVPQYYPPTELLWLQSRQNLSLCSCCKFETGLGKPGAQNPGFDALTSSTTWGVWTGRCCNTWWNNNGRWTKGIKTWEGTALSSGRSSVKEGIFPIQTVSGLYKTNK